MDLPSKFIAKTSFGTFQVKIFNRSFITIGSTQGCVQISINPSNQAKLEWLGTEKGGCEETGKKIHGTDTIAMTDLGFTIMKQLYPDVNPYVRLQDSSSFHCIIPGGNKVSISNMIYNLLIKGKTYYQDRFDATLLYKESQIALDMFINAWSVQLIQKDFDFENKDLNEELQPILQIVNHWNEFFNKLYDKYNRNTCIFMHSWYLRLYGMLAKIPIHTEWQIDTSKRSIILYDIIETRNIRSNTRKTFEYNPYVFAGGYYPQFISYKHIVSSRINKATRKQKRA